MNTDDLTAAVERLRATERLSFPDGAPDMSPVRSDDVLLVLSALETAQQDAQRYYDACQNEQTSGSTEGRAQSDHGEPEVAGPLGAATVGITHPATGKGRGPSLAGIESGPLDHQSAATPSAGRPDAGAAQAATDGPAADPIDDLCARLYSLAKPHTYMLREEAAIVIERLRVERDEARRECVEQARLLGMSGSREAALIAERDTLAAIVRAPNVCP